jgi:hypothetical protein
MECQEKVAAHFIRGNIYMYMRGKYFGIEILEGINVAERVGFEPTVEFPLHTLSKRAP